ncbi:GGDEF domain-containing protein [Turneriella parva]|uniref:Diguanylate cyclase/phosphodiesterase with CBS domains n=1 Tax=Turneriella parva (strain ATCC BAA-1111 / DSM 21527 / NCTC 11395 / H) TaxID=869212 RepID=I4B593_TURPD|nr:bifunctional diguanylate cyclase/phosphodiesterase [Turneriella parva]AFM12450.1 diguanylate cyclase/phosphodiesterase with CBS domains [Turneriella parva DSM 21527]
MDLRASENTAGPEHNYRGPIPDAAAGFSRWRHLIKQLDFALQPIVHASTGSLYGVEALVRGFGPLGFETPKDLFDAAYHDNALFFADIRLRELAIAKFKQLPFHQKLILFYNYDPRILQMPDYRPGVTERLMTNFDLSCDQICFEINEKYEIGSNAVLNAFVKNLQSRGIKIALDDFGAGYAGFELFYHSEPNVLKFDRFLISNIESDARKRNLCSHIVNLCKVQGVTTIAEGVETEAELQVCCRMGFDLIQGFIVERPQTDVRLLRGSYAETIQKQAPLHQRQEEDAELLKRSILRIEPIDVTADVRSLLDMFHDQVTYNFLPVVDSNRYPLGIIHERDLKKYIYSPFGRELLANKSVTHGLRSFITRNPVTDVNTPQEKILEIFINNPESEGVIFVKDMQYFGFLNAKSLLSVINEKQIAAARDTNPLSGLPGNRLIHAFADNLLGDLAAHGFMAYMDFDHFKPFNDHFGFRQGDRAITIFARILREVVPSEVFVGHIGGDDFFLGLNASLHQQINLQSVTDAVRLQFEAELLPFFSHEERVKKTYKTIDRSGEAAELPLLTVSTAIIELKPGRQTADADQMSMLLAQTKKTAKHSPEKMAVAVVGL